MTDEEVFGFLLAKVQQARREFWKAKDRLWIIASKSDAPGSVRIELLYPAIAEENIAMEAYKEATTRLNRYLLEGKIPDEVIAKLTEHSVQLQ